LKSRPEVNKGNPVFSEENDPIFGISALRDELLFDRVAISRNKIRESDSYRMKELKLFLLI